MKKKFLILPLTLSLISSPVLAIVGCNKNERIEAQLPDNLSDTFFAIFTTLNEKNNISKKSLFNKFRSKIYDYGLQIIKEAVIRNEFIRLSANSEQKNLVNLSKEEKEKYNNQLTKKWDELATNILYQEYLRNRIDGNIFEAKIAKQGYEINQDDEWHILGSWNSTKQNVYLTTKEPTIEELLNKNDEELKKFKLKLVNRFKNYYEQKTRPSILNNLFLMIWLQNRIFKINKSQTGTQFSLNQRYLVPQAIQTWNETSIWKSKIKMVWEMKVKVDNQNKLPKIEDTNLIPNESLIDTFKSKYNQVKTLNDPIFNMAGFRGFVTYKNDSGDLYGDNTMEENYRSAVLNKNKAGFASEKPTTQDKEIFDFYSSDRNHISRVYVLPFYLLDLLQNYKINNKDIEIEPNLKYKWLNNKDKNDSSITNADFHNTKIQNLDQNTKELIFNNLLYAISKNNSEYENAATKELYVRYIQNKENIFDKTIWESIKGDSIFPTEE